LTMNIHVGFSDIMNTILIHNVSFDVVEPGYRLDSRYHKIFEILYCYDGEVFEWLNEQSLNFCSGDWLFINSGVRHRTFNNSNQPFSFFAIHFDIDDPDIRILLKSFRLEHNFIPRSIAEQSLLHIYIQSIESIIQTILVDRKYENPTENLTKPQYTLTPLQKLSFQANILLIIQEMMKLQQRELLEEPNLAMKSASSSELDVANQIASLLEQSPKETISIQSIAKKVNLSRSQCSKIFTKVYGIPPRKYLSEFIIKKSKDLLLQTNFTIEEVSQILGFSSVQHFSKQFHRWTGFAPTKFRPHHKIRK
jgi:AraC family transcriptional regulator